MPLVIRFGMVACMVAAVLLFGAMWGTGNPAFADVDKAISEQKSVRIQVDIDVQMPNSKQKEKRVIFASTKPLILRAETADGNIEILDVAAGKRLLIHPQKKAATLHVLPQLGDKTPKTLLETLQLHFNTKSQLEPSREKLDGHEMLVYEIEQPTMTKKSAIKEKMWVDTRTKLPVKVLGEIVSTDPKKSQYFSRVTMSDFQWNPPAASAPKFFSTEPPSGFEYQMIDMRSADPKKSDSDSPDKS